MSKTNKNYALRGEKNISVIAFCHSAQHRLKKNQLDFTFYSIPSSICDQKI